MTTSEWLPIDTQHLTRPWLESWDGSEVEMQLSPFDLPRRLRGIDLGKNRLRLEFEYPGQSEPRASIRSEGVRWTIEVGVASGRVFAIEADRANLRDAVESLRTALGSGRDDPRRIRNGKLGESAAQAVKQKRDELKQRLRVSLAM